MSEMVPCADFMFDVPIETGTILLNSSSWDVLFAVVCDYCIEVFYGSVYVCVVVNIEIS